MLPSAIEEVLLVKQVTQALQSKRFAHGRRFCYSTPKLDQVPSACSRVPSAETTDLSKSGVAAEMFWKCQLPLVQLVCLTMRNAEFVVPRFKVSARCAVEQHRPIGFRRLLLMECCSCYLQFFLGVMVTKGRVQHMLA